VTALLAMRMADLQARGAMTLANTQHIHARLAKAFGHLRPTDVTREAAHRYIAERPATSARRELEELKLALKHGEHPYKHIPMPPQPAPRDLALSREQANAILAHCHAYHLRLWCMIAMTTGRRMRAILGLTWDRVDLDRRVLDFDDPTRRRTKKRRGAVPISRPLMAALQDARELAVTPFVIEYRGRQVDNIGQGFRQAARDAGLPWACPHVLKHSVITWLASDGTPIEEIAQFTATSVETVRRVYLKHNPEGHRDAAERLADGLMFGHRADYGKRKTLKARRTLG
jgi:integrase